jgi:hypothetical protein
VRLTVFLRCRAAVQLRMSGFKVLRFCDPLARADGYTVRPVHGKDGL